MSRTLEETLGQVNQKVLHQKLDDIDVSAESKERIFQLFWRGDAYNSIISYEPYFKLFKTFLKKGNVNRTFTRPEFYDFIFSDIISRNFKKKEVDQATTLLYQIALIFEKMQTDAMPVKEYMKILEKIETPKDWFKTEWMKSNHLAKIEERDKIPYLVLAHHTLSEYLVAQYLLSHEEPIEELQNLIILKQEDFTGLKSSWFGVLRFLLESEIDNDIMSWLIDYLEDHTDDLDDGLSDIITYTTTVVSDDLKKRIFDLIYGIYYKRALWISVWSRKDLSRFIDKARYQQLKKDLESGKNKTEKLVHTGNVVAIVHGLLENNSELLSKRDKIFWKKKFVKYAQGSSETNGVLQRHSLHALEYFHEASIISKVANNFAGHDSLVRDAFLKFCIETDPNSKQAIDYLVRGVKETTSIYARHGLYEITKKTAIKYFLELFASDIKFIKKFREHEGIYEKENGDIQLIRHIKKVIDQDILDLLKKIIRSTFEASDIYQEEQSYFLVEAAKMVTKHQPDYLFEILTYIRDNSENKEKMSRRMYDYSHFIALQLTKKNIKEYMDFIKSFPSLVKRRADNTIYYVSGQNKKNGQKIYEKAIEYGLEPLPEPKKERDYEQERKTNAYASFQYHLEPVPKKYNPSVFEYFLQNRKDIEECWSEDDKKRLIYLAITEGIEKIDPRKFQVSFKDSKKGNRSFTWSAPASYYGDVLRVLEIFAPTKIDPHRQDIINFIPCAFSDDMSLILKLFPKVQDDELAFVHSVMNNAEDTRRYLEPGTYIYMMAEYAKHGCHLPDVKHILKSFIYDDNIDDHHQREALEALEYFIDDKDTETKKWLENIFRIINKGDAHRHLAYIANALLIKVYQDDEAIDWRFKQIKKPLKFERQPGFHTVDDTEMELDFMHFAKPLIELHDKKYLSKFLDILQHSINLSAKAPEQKTWEYVLYLRHIVFSYVKGLKIERSFKPFKALQSFIESNAIEANSNWLRADIGKLKDEYIQYIGKQASKKIPLNRHSLLQFPSQYITKTNLPTEDINSPINYERKRTTLLPIKKSIKIFISHATRGKDVPQPVKDFVDNLYNILENQYGSKKIYLDFKNKSDLQETYKALVESEYGLFICTDRFLNRYLNKTDSVIVEEVMHFARILKKDSSKVMAIALNITRNDVMDRIPPFTDRIHVIEPPYEDNQLSIIDLAISVANDISKKII